MSSRVVVVGQGYVGLPLALRAVEVGYDVVALDVNVHRIARLRAGKSYVDDVSDAMLQAALETRRFLPTTSYEEAVDFAYAVVTVPTPLRDGAPDLSFIELAMRSIAPRIIPGSTVILESTTYPGTTENLARPILEEGSGLRAGVDFHLGYSPERIDPGNPRWNFTNTPKIVSGINATSLQMVQAFYSTLVDTVVPVSGTREAEMAKLLENTFRHVNIALVNELAICAHHLGIDIDEVIDAASTKPFGFMPFRPGPGVGGHCLPVDPSYLSWEVKRTVGQSLRFVELANDINAHMPRYVVQRLSELLNRHRRTLSGCRVLLLGLAYKRDSGDCRESPALRVATLLHEQDAEVWAVDNHVDPTDVPTFISLVPFDAKHIAAADVVVLLTDHSDIDYNLLTEASLVFDTRGRLRHANVERL
jgi:UDP-N-acetyl-D-glucosamine dehydrogenase